MQTKTITFIAGFLLFWSTAHAQLTVNVAAPKVTGSKTVVKLDLKNGFHEIIESARAACFVMDEQGKVVGQSTKWVIGGSKPKQDLPPGATATFNFVIPTERAASTNLTAKVSFSRVILEGGKLADPIKEVTITPATK